jgi:hypothetical protein
MRWYHFGVKQLAVLGRMAGLTAESAAIYAEVEKSLRRSFGPREILSDYEE